MESEKVNDLTQYEYEYNEADTNTILIDLVKNFPHLYDKSVADFKNIQKKDRAWMKISSIIKLPGNFLGCIYILLIFYNFDFYQNFSIYSCRLSKQMAKAKRKIFS